MEKQWKKVFENVAGNKILIEIESSTALPLLLASDWLKYTTISVISFITKYFHDFHRSIRIGKILINEGHVIYAKLPSDIHRRRLLVAYPVITTGSTVLTGLEVLLKDYQCKQSNMILITLFSTPDGLKHICELYPDITIVISEINTVAPNHFGQKYFGKRKKILRFEFN